MKAYIYIESLSFKMGTPRCEMNLDSIPRQGEHMILSGEDRSKLHPIQNIIYEAGCAHIILGLRTERW